MSGMVRPPLTEEPGAPLRRYPGPVGYYCPLLPHHNAQRPTQPPDPTQEMLALLVVHQLVAVAVFGIAKDGPPHLVRHSVVQYPVLGHSTSDAVVRGVGSGNSAAPTSFVNVCIISKLY